MPSWWGKSSSKEAKNKAAKESFIDTLQRKFKSPEAAKSSTRKRSSGGTVSERGSHSQAQSRSPSPSKYAARCQSFAERPHAHPLPLQRRQPAKVSRSNSGIDESAKPKVEKASKTSLFLPFPKPACIRPRLQPCDLDVEEPVAVASISGESSVDSDDPTDSTQPSPLDTDCDIGRRTAVGSPSNISTVDHPLAAPSSKGSRTPVNISSNKIGSSPPPRARRRMLKAEMPNLLVPRRGIFFSATDSSMSSPSRSPIRGPGFLEQGASNILPSMKQHHTDFPYIGSGQCSSPGSGQTSGHNSMGGDMYGQLFWQPSRGSPEYSPNPSPRMTSAGPSSRIHSGAVTPTHPRAVGLSESSLNNRADDAKQQSHRLPLPPITISNCPFSHQSSAVTSPSVPRSPGAPENLASPPGARWKKGKLLGRGTFGHVYVGFNSETGEMCAMKEVTLFADDAKSKESAKQLGQEIALLSRLRHPNIVQYYGSETVGDRVYIYLEYVSGGSIHKILQDYGKLGESAVRSYTQQILSGLAYLHGKNTVHRDIKGANILVDPSGRVKLADFGMAKHIAGQSCPLSFKGSPYWMAPEVIKNPNGCSLVVDIWSLGCTVVEMATAKPPWSQYEGVAAMFKIGNSKELPSIPETLSEEGKEFVRLCLQRNPLHRPTAAQLLEHPFVKGGGGGGGGGGSSSAFPAEKHAASILPDHPPPPRSETVLAVHSSRLSKSSFNSSDLYVSSRNISCPVSPVGSPLLHPRSPSPISSPQTTSGSSTPLTGCVGAIPSRHQLRSPQEGLASLQIRSPGPPSYWDPDILIRGGGGGVHSGTTTTTTSVFKQSSLLHGQSILVDRVSQQLLKDPVKFNDHLLSPAGRRKDGGGGS